VRSEERALAIAFCVRALFPQHGYGGLERAASAQIRHLLARGMDVALFTQPLPTGQPFKEDSGLLVSQHSTQREDRLTIRTVRYGRLPLRPNGIAARLTNYRAFVEAMGKRVEVVARRGRVQVAYAHGLCAWGVRNARQWGVPLVANPHGLEEFKVQDPLKRLAYAPFRGWIRKGCQAADSVLATDHAMRVEVSRYLGLDDAKVVVIPNGVDISHLASLVDEKVKEALQQRWQMLEPYSGALRGVSVGRLEENKGFETLLRALAEVREELGKDWTWTIVGEGSLKEHLSRVAAQLGIGQRVIFTGSLSDTELHSLYEMSNLFAHPALYEGSSLVTLEAMAHRLPVVASAVGGIPDKVIDGVTGYLIQPGKPEELGAKIALLAGTLESRRAMGERGSHLVSERFSMESVAAKLERLFMDLIAVKSPCREEVTSSPC